MTEADAIQLIHKGVPDKPENAAWADLGAGSGTFTNALAQVLGKNSTILAVDKANQHILSPNTDVTILFLQADFIQAALPDNLDGIIMANALHYVEDQAGFMVKMVKNLKATGQMIFVEYDTHKSNTWVPYPIPYSQLHKLLLHAGFRTVEKIGERNSIYRQDKMYACTARL